MSYGMATHGPWCNSRTYPTRCRYCGERVFYFTCDHDCRVFFDELGSPWPEHRCIEYLTAQYGHEFVEWGMAVMMMTPGVETGRRIDQSYASKIQQELATAHEPEIVRCEPYDGAVTQEEGIVRELIPWVNVFRRFNIPEDSVLGTSLLGPLAKSEYAQMTIHTGALAGEDSFSFTFFVSHKLLDRKGVIVGDFVSCQLRAFAVPGRRIVWLCDKLVGAFD